MLKVFAYPLRVACLTLTASFAPAIAGPIEDSNGPEQRHDPAAQEQPIQSTSLLGWSRGKLVKEVNGRIAGGWANSVLSACAGETPTTYIDAASLTRFQIVGKCPDGDAIYFYTRRAQPLPPSNDACSFDYVTVGGIIPGIFQEVVETSANADAMRGLRKALPNMRHAFATKQGGGYVALVGWTVLPPGSSVEESEKTLSESAERAKKAVAVTESTYTVDHEAPISLISITDYQESGQQRRNAGMDVIANEKCLYSIKFSGARHPGDDDNWRSIQSEFQRVRRVIKDHEGGLPTAISGAK
jgi:hypothetical protein